MLIIYKYNNYYISNPLSIINTLELCSNIKLSIPNIQYYLIHNTDISRKNRMIEQFQKWGFNMNKIKWINHPNKDEISDELIDSLIIKEPSYSCGILIDPNRTRNLKGLVCCTYKHYLALKDIVDNNYDYGVIIEDNITFKDSIPFLINKYIKQLNTYYNNWDILFDSYWGNYSEGEVRPDILVYPKSNEIKSNSHGGTRTAVFYLIKRECAKKLIDHYIPFNNSPD